MHELSLANNILQTVVEAVPAGSNVKEIHLHIGALSGVIDDSLSFAFDVIREGTSLASASLVIERTPISFHCAQCDKGSAIEGAPASVRCPHCNTVMTEFLTGKEFEISHVVMGESNG